MFKYKQVINEFYLGDIEHIHYKRIDEEMNESIELHEAIRIERALHKIHCSIQDDILKVIYNNDSNGERYALIKWMDKTFNYDISEIMVGIQNKELKDMYNVLLQSILTSNKHIFDLCIDDIEEQKIRIRDKENKYRELLFTMEKGLKRKRY